MPPLREKSTYPGCSDFRNHLFISWTQITVRVKVQGENVVQTFKLYDKEGEAAFSKLQAVARTSGEELKRLRAALWSRRPMPR